MFIQMDKQGYIDLPKDEWVSGEEHSDYCLKVFPSDSLITLLAQKSNFHWALLVHYIIFFVFIISVGNNIRDSYHF